VQQGKNLGEAAVAAGVKFVIYSGGERIGVDAMDNKAKIEVRDSIFPTLLKE
jgi:hypothetical protein